MNTRNRRHRCSCHLAPCPFAPQCHCVANSDGSLSSAKGDPEIPYITNSHAGNWGSPRTKTMSPTNELHIQPPPTPLEARVPTEAANDDDDHILSLHPWDHWIIAVNNGARLRPKCIIRYPHRTPYPGQLSPL